jgi:hypothetical protein
MRDHASGKMVGKAQARLLSTLRFLPGRKFAERTSQKKSRQTIVGRDFSVLQLKRSAYFRASIIT